MDVQGLIENTKRSLNPSHVTHVRMGRYGLNKIIELLFEEFGEPESQFDFVRKVEIKKFAAERFSFSVTSSTDGVDIVLQVFIYESGTLFVFERA